MRLLITVTIPDACGTRAIKDGSMGRIIGAFLETWSPESAVFGTDGGDRTAIFVVDVPDLSQLPEMFDPLVDQLDATIVFKPVLGATEAQAGLDAFAD